MDKLSVLCITKLIERFNTNNSLQLRNLVQEISEWLTKSVKTIGELKSFNDVQKELMNVAQYIVQGKIITRKSANNLFVALKIMQEEMLIKTQIVVFVTPMTKLKFKDNVKVVVVENEEKCINMSYDMKDELKYLLLVNEEVSLELRNSVDIIISLEELIENVNRIYPIDVFVYDRLHLTAKLNKIAKEKCKVLLTGSSYTLAGLIENKMPYDATNVGVNGQDLYYTLLSVKEAINRSENLDAIVISLPYYFFFTNINEPQTDDELSVLSKINYPVYKKLHGYTGELLPLYNKTQNYPIYEAILDLNLVRDIFYDAIVKDLEKLPYFNDINIRPENGMLNYKFIEQSDERNFSGAKELADIHNSKFDLDRGIYNQKLLDNFLDNMEELNKKVIFIVPPVTKFYKESLSKDMINAYNQLAVTVINAHKCSTFINLFDSDKFNENDFQDYDHLNCIGATKLSKIVSSYL